MPFTPTNGVYMNIPADSEMLVGKAGNIPGWGNGGGEQYYLDYKGEGYIPNSYVDFTRLIAWGD